MPDQRLSRRKLLAVFSVAGVGGLSLGGGSSIARIADTRSAGVEGETPDKTGSEESSNKSRSDGSHGGSDGDPPATPGGSSGRDQTGTPQRNLGSDVVDVRRYGARADGRTDDAPAIRAALEDVPPDGTVLLPPGDLVIDTQEDPYAAITLADRHRNVSVVGNLVGDGTTLRMAAGQDGPHHAFRITGQSARTDDEIRVAHLSVDLNAPNQDTVGTAIKTDRPDGTFSMHDCRVASTRNSGLKMEGGMDGDIRYCAFADNGAEAYGHAISPNQELGETTTTIRNVLCTGQRGVAIDIGTDADADKQTVHIERCVLRNSMGGVKVDPTAASVTVGHTRIVGDASTRIPIKMNPFDFHVGTVRLNNVLIDGGGWPGIDFPNGSTLELHDVAVKNIDKSDETRGRSRGGIRTEHVDLGSSGRVSVHNVGVNDDGPALKLFDGAGSVEELRYGGAGGLGTTDGVSIEDAKPGTEPLEPDVASERDVGPRPIRL